MTALGWLIPISLVLGGAGLLAFLWSIRAGQYRDLAGGGERILLPDDPEPRIPPLPFERAPAAERAGPADGP